MRNQHPWLGDVGQGFRVGRLKYGLASMTAGGTPDTDNESYWSDDGLPWVAIADMSRADFVFGTQKCVTSAGISDKRLQPLEVGSLLYSMYASLGQVAELRVPAVTNQAILGLQFNGSDVYSRYAFWQLKAIQPYVVEFSSSNTQNNLNAEKVGNLPFIFPSLKMQERIANFLDEQTARIDALIAGKEQLNERLEELRLARIYTALSRSVVDASTVRSTRDEWFSSVPAHWSFCPLNYRYEVQLGKMLDEKKITGEHLLPYLRNTDVQWDRVNVEGLPAMDFAPHELERYTLRMGDLLVCEGGEVGRAAIWTAPTVEIGYQKALHRVRPRDTRTDVPRFLFYALYDSAKRGRFDSREKATIAHLTAEAFRRYRFPFPPYTEQVSIVRHLDNVMNKIDSLQQHAEEHCSKLKEYRSSLISAAVIGQIDINNFQMEAA